MGRCALLLYMLFGGAHSIYVPHENEAKHNVGDKEKIKHEAKHNVGDKEKVKIEAKHNVGDKEKVKIEFYYETLCPYCRRFISDSLVPLWENKEFSKVVNITMYPYGNAMTLSVKNVSAGYKFWHRELQDKNIDNIFECQHYERECFGNLLHSCAIQHLQGPKQYMPLFKCMALHVQDSLEKSSYECAQELGISMKSLRNCTRGREGSVLLEKYGKKTLGLKEPKGPKKWVPWVVMNGAHNKRAELDADKGYSGFLMDEVCKQLKLEFRPKACITVKTLSPSGADRNCPLWIFSALSLAAVLQVFF